MCCGVLLCIGLVPIEPIRVVCKKRMSTHTYKQRRVPHVRRSFQPAAALPTPPSMSLGPAEIDILPIIGTIACRACADLVIITHFSRAKGPSPNIMGCVRFTRAQKGGPVGAHLSEHKEVTCMYVVVITAQQWQTAGQEEHSGCWPNVCVY